MKLLVDAGNSRLKWGLLDRGRLRGGQPVPFADDSELALGHAFDHLPAPESVTVCSVRGAEFEEIAAAWMRARWSLTPHFVRSRAQGYGVRNDYGEPRTLGADRWVAAVALRAAGELPACVVDCGTAVTVDTVDAAARFRGGVIFPGLAASTDTLLSRTRAIAPAWRAVRDQGPDVLARSTATAVAAGTLLCVTGGIDRALEAVAARLGVRPAAVITGGDAATLLPWLASAPRHEPDLLLQGLAVIAESARP